MSTVFLVKSEHDFSVGVSFCLDIVKSNWKTIFLTR